ncbi:monocarboxylate transporter 12-like [Amphiura filiformis]|uniref:monocarboxylate transporter 12-like n=1 Tax=Amphiura filiformis TaxID=82378 RepID=UPI003B21474F
MAAVEIGKVSAWFVCLRASVTYFMSTGLIKALGVLLPILRQQFATETWIIGLTISLVPGFGGVATFIIGAEAILAGELAKYFDQHYGLANAIARSGISIGIVVMPFLTQFLNDVYGWRGALLLLGALNFHSVISGLLLKSTSHHVPDDETAFPLSLNTEKNPAHQQLSRTIAYFVDLELLLNPIVLKRIVYNLGSAYAFVGWMIYLVPNAIDIGISPYRAASLSAIGGIGNLLGNATFPLLKKKLLNEHILYMTTLVVCLSLVGHSFLSLLKSYNGLVVASFTFGFARGPATLASYQIAKENIEEDKINDVCTWMLVAYSIGSVTSGFLSGWIYDETGSYTVSFLTLGLVALLAVAPQPFVNNVQNQQKSQYSQLPE